MSVRPLHREIRLGDLDHSVKQPPNRERTKQPEPSGDLHRHLSDWCWRGISNWSLSSLQQRLAKTGGRLIRQARYYWLLLAESYLTRRLFGSLLRKIAAIPAPAGEGE